MGLPVELWGSWCTCCIVLADISCAPRFAESQSILNLFKCTACKGILQDPMILCKHIAVCRVHVERVQESPVVQCLECKTGPTERPVEAAWMQAQIKSMKIRCQNQGCTTSTPNIEEHKLVVGSTSSWTGRTAAD